MLSYYFDHQVPEAVAIGLRERSVDVLTAREDGTEEWEDRDILERATILDRVVFTMDDDLLSIADEWVEQQREFGAWSTLTSCASAQAVRHLELLAHAVPADEIRNRIVFIPL
jgi:hypothetical protein